MRHGGFKFEVRGSDRSSAPKARDAAINTAHGSTNPLTNQAGMLMPSRSAWFQGMMRGVTTFIREMNPLMRPVMFDNNIGTNWARPARNIAVVADPGYDGILPLSQQPKIAKPLPYKDG